MWKSMKQLINRLTCWCRGHKWKGHGISMNPEDYYDYYDCARCGKIKEDVI